MSKTKLVYTCQSCGGIASKWNGQCGDCGEWNTYTETLQHDDAKSKVAARMQGYAGELSQQIQLLGNIDTLPQARIVTGLSEFDRVLGGGLVVGSVVLIGGDPGIGKSTILLQTLAQLSQQQPVLYVTGEESLQQISMRAQRLELNSDKIQLLAETQVERIIAVASQVKPMVMVIDSIQTLFTELSPAAPGAVSQVRETAAQLVQFAKRSNVALFLVGHVTKDGQLAGPRVLEHMVDTVLYFEGQSDSRFRLIRAIKNRFGAVNELGIFAMTEKGLREVNNPSAIFLSKHPKPISGSVIMITWEGSRPVLIEIQALVDTSYGGQPRRVSVGVDPNRLTLCLAVLSRHGGVNSSDQDVFINVVGGVKISETGTDLALMLAVLSSLRNRPLPQDLVVFGEVGLAGEVRPVQGGQERLKEAVKHGFKRAIVPSGNVKKTGFTGLQVHAVDDLAQVMAVFADL